MLYLYDFCTYMYMYILPVVHAFIQSLMNHVQCTHVHVEVTPTSVYLLTLHLYLIKTANHPQILT